VGFRRADLPAVQTTLHGERGGREVLPLEGHDLAGPHPADAGVRPRKGSTAVCSLPFAGARLRPTRRGSNNPHRFFMLVSIRGELICFGSFVNRTLMVTTCSTASKTLSQEVRKASAVSFHDGRLTQRARKSM
jgi:hypothetical protein